MCRYVQSLQDECDRIQNSLDDEIVRRKRAESDVKLNIELIATLKVELEEVKVERSRLVSQVESAQRERQEGERARSGLESDSKALLVKVAQLGSEKSDLSTQLIVKEQEIESINSGHSKEVSERELDTVTGSR